jgi:hypothetical protein
MVALDAYASIEPEVPLRQLMATAGRATLAVALGAVAIVWIAQRLPSSHQEEARPPEVAAAPAPASPYGAIFDPGFLAGSRQSFAPPRAMAANAAADRLSLAAAIPTPSAFAPAARPTASADLRRAPQMTLAALPPAEEAIPKPVVAPSEQATPLPPPRPVEAMRPAPVEAPPVVAPAPVAPAHEAARSGRGVAALAATPDNKNYFPPAGAPRLVGRTLSYAAPATIGIGVASFPHTALFGASGRYDQWTAVYDLAAHTVYMPDGRRLEAHSGLGDRLDDPGHVSERARGATPPHLYELALREQPFHGVQALRLNPVGGGDLFGRAGLLAHTYMLGPNGDSNGCVSFRDYDAFLNAFRSGEVKRLAVVARLD